MTWDELLQNVAQVKHNMYVELRKVAEPMINEYLNNKSGTDVKEDQQTLVLDDKPHQGKE